MIHPARTGSVLAWLLLFAGASLAGANTTPQPLPFSQDWSSRGMITVNDDWSGVPGVMGYRGQGMGVAEGADPQTVLNTDATGPRVWANFTDPLGPTTAGVVEFQLTDDVVALAGGPSANGAPHLILYVDATGQQGITVSYRLRDIEGAPGTDDAIQSVALQYRVGNVGAWSNVPAGFVADASSGPGLTLDTPVSAVLPADANGAANLQIRILTTNAVGNDEWIGVDDISVVGSPPAFVDVTPAVFAGGGNSRGMAWGYADSIPRAGHGAALYVTALGTANKVFRYQATSGTWAVDSSSGVGGAGAGGGVVWGQPDFFRSAAYSWTDGTWLRNTSRLSSGLFQTSIELAVSGAVSSMARADYDLDGDGDLFVARVGAPSLLVRMDPFATSASPPAGLPTAGDAYGADWGDYDGDGDSDLLIARSTLPSVIARNLGGGAFDSLGFGAVATHSARAATWADFDDDGDLDVFLTRDGAACALLRNDAGTWVDVTPAPLLATSAWRGAAWADFDLDGDLDLYAGRSGAVGVLLRNDGGSWTDFTGSSLAMSALTSVEAVTWCDFDADGDPDLFVTQSGGTNRLLRNDASSGHHWLRVIPNGRYSTPFAGGMRVRIVVGGVSRVRTITGGSGYLAQGPPCAEFGLGSATAIDSLIVEWQTTPTLRTTAITAVDRTVAIFEGSPTFARGTLLNSPGSETGAAWRNSLRVGTPLLVHRGSIYQASTLTGPLQLQVSESQQLSPDAMVLFGAVDPNQLYLDMLEMSNPSARYLAATGGPIALFGVDSSTAVWSSASFGTRPVASWVDANGDGHLDAHVASATANRLLARTASGWTDITPVAFPTSGVSAVAWADVDSDLQPDVFMVRSNAPHRLLKQQGGSWIDATTGSLAAAPIASEGTDAHFADYDDDGDLDLLVVDSNGARLHRQQSGDWIEVADPALAALPPGIVGAATADFDLDGDLDLFFGRRGGLARILLNDGAGAFVDASAPPFTLQMEPSGVPALCDLDEDGAVDLFVPDDVHFGFGALYKNNLGIGRHWFRLELEGVTSNNRGVGARVEVVAGGRRQVRTVSADLDFLSQSETPITFGLGSATVIDTIRIRWPSGTHFDTTGVAADQSVTWVEHPRTLAAAGGPAPDRLELAVRGAQPFRGELVLEYALPERSQVRLTVHDVQGRQHASLISDERSAGRHVVRWSPAGALSSGVYWVRLHVRDGHGGQVRTARAVLVH